MGAIGVLSICVAGMGSPQAGIGGVRVGEKFQNRKGEVVRKHPKAGFLKISRFGGVIYNQLQRSRRRNPPIPLLQALAVDSTLSFSKFSFLQTLAVQVPLDRQRRVECFAAVGVNTLYGKWLCRPSLLEFAAFLMAEDSVEPETTGFHRQ